MQTLSYVEAPPNFKIIKKFVDLFLFENPFAVLSKEGNLIISSELSMCLEDNPKDYTKKDNNQDLLMLHFENTITLFLEISTLQDRKALFDWYSKNPNKAIVNQLVTLQRKNYSFQFRYFPLNLREELLEYSLVEMKMIPIQIFTVLANHLARLDWYISQKDGEMTVEQYQSVYRWIFEYHDYTGAITHSTDGFLTYVKGKPRDLHDFKNENEIKNHLAGLKETIENDYLEYSTSEIKTIEFKK